MSTTKINYQVIGSGYLTTLQGICKIIEVACSFIGVLLVGIKFYGWVIIVFEIAASVSIIVSAILLILYVTGLVEKLPVPMNRVQCGFHASWGTYYLISDILVLYYGSAFSKIIAGGVFGLVAAVAHIVDAIDNYKKAPYC